MVFILGTLFVVSVKVGNEGWRKEEFNSSSLFLFFLGPFFVGGLAAHLLEPILEERKE